VNPSHITSVPDGREVIDALDCEIIRLMQRRRKVSQVVQTLRRREGAPGVQYAREREIVARYGEPFGSSGVEIGLAILSICRG
jgi:chorismate mutase